MPAQFSRVEQGKVCGSSPRANIKPTLPHNENNEQKIRSGQTSKVETGPGSIVRVEKTRFALQLVQQKKKREPRRGKKGGDSTLNESGERSRWEDQGDKEVEEQVLLRSIVMGMSELDLVSISHHILSFRKSRCSCSEGSSEVALWC